MSTIIYTITEIYDKLQKLPQKIEKQLFPEEFKKEITITGIIKSIRDYYNNKYIILYNKNNKLTCFCNKSLNEIITQLEENIEITFQGYLRYKYLLYNNTYELQFNITKLITIKSENTYIEDLINLCQKNNLFFNKKNINWLKIKRIALLSKYNTHGYNDFITHIRNLQNYITIKLYDIILEGNNTEKSLIETINYINENNNILQIDLILICRGGGSTENISLSYDKLNIFQCIKQSNIPICSAIGHSDDKDIKLLITNITDYNFTTPTEAGIFIYNVYINKINNKLDKLYNKLINEKDNILQLLLKEYQIYYEKILKIKSYLTENINYVYLNENIKNTILVYNNTKYILDLNLLKKIDNRNHNYKINEFIINQLQNFKYNELNILNINNEFLNTIKYNKLLYNYCNELYNIYYLNNNIYDLQKFYNILNEISKENIFNLLKENNFLNNNIININNKIIKLINIIKELI